MRNIRTATAVAAVITTFSGFLAFNNTYAAELDKLDLTYIPANSVYWDLDVGVEKGFFKEEGFDAHILANQSSVQSMQMLISGQVEIAISQPDPLIAAIDKGATAVGIIAAPATEADWFLIGKKGIKSVADLKGQTLGFSGLRVGEFYLTRDILKANGIGPNDSTAVQIGPTPAKYAALQKGSIAAGVLFQPTATLAQQNGFPVLLRFAQKIKGFPSIVYLANRKWAATNNHGKRFTQALERVHEWLYDPKNKDEAIAILEKYTKRSKEVITKVYDLYFVTDKLYSKTGALNVADMEKTVQLIAENTNLPKDRIPKPAQYLIPASDGGLLVQH
jgi:ABC-type nitrate/sulfonate/bicarbonate transport system substrate-binding protein